MAARSKTKNFCTKTLSIIRIYLVEFFVSVRHLGIIIVPFSTKITTVDIPFSVKLMTVIGLLSVTIITVIFRLLFS